MLHESTRIGIQGSAEKDVLSTLTIGDNGLVLQGVLENGRLKARPSNALANSIFLGFSWGIVGSGVPSLLPYAETKKTSAASGGFSTYLMDFPVAASGQITVILGTGFGGQVLAPTASNTTAPADATHYQLGADGRTITVTDANAGKDLFVFYRYSPTTESARWIYGDKIPGNNAPQNFGRIGVITDGLVVTDQFDPSVNWAAVGDVSAGNILRGGANGLLTIGGNGCVVNGKLVHVPTLDLPFLGVAVGESVGA